MAQFTPDKVKETRSVSIRERLCQHYYSVTHVGKRVPPQMQNRVSKLVPLAKHALTTTPEIMAQDSMDGHVTKKNIHPSTNGWMTRVDVFCGCFLSAPLCSANLGLLCAPAKNPKKPTANPTPIHRCTAKTP